MRLPIPRAVLFDLDGTLADTAPDLAGAINRIRYKRGLAPTPYEQLRPFASAGARGLIGASFGLKPGDEGYETLRIDFLDEYETGIAEESRLFDGMRETLSGLEIRGIPWGIVTNKAARFTEQLVPLIGLAHAACVVSGDTTPHPKPHPAPLLEAARQLQVEARQCWYVGDDLRDIQAGKAAGMATIAAVWGYCGEAGPAEWGADVQLTDPREILGLIADTH